MPSAVDEGTLQLEAHVDEHHEKRCCSQHDGPLTIESTSIVSGVEASDVVRDTTAPLVMSQGRSSLSAIARAPPRQARYSQVRHWNELSTGVVRP